MKRRTFVSRLAAGVLAAALLRDDLLSRRPAIFDNSPRKVLVRLTAEYPSGERVISGEMIMEVEEGEGSDVGYVITFRDTDGRSGRVRLPRDRPIGRVIKVLDGRNADA